MSKNKKMRINEYITCSQVRLVDQDANQHGLVYLAEALKIAKDAGLDLVEVSPNASPPVCRVMDYGKLSYHKKKQVASKKGRVSLKEIKFRPNTDTHDYEVKMKSVVKFLANGDKVKITMRFRGREMAHQRLGLELLNRVENDLLEVGKVENMPKLEGRQMVMLIGPARNA